MFAEQDMSNPPPAPGPADYPPPGVPNAPLPSFGICARGGDASVASVRDAGNVLWLGSGRAAIAMALRAAGIGDTGTVLLPAYHCTSMVEPVRACGARPDFYRVSPDLSPDLADLEARAGADVRAVIVVHYFGFPQDLGAVRALCDRRGMILIEDCAHACFGSFDGRPPGAIGDYAIASLTKFFPVADGGWLASARHSLDGLGLRPPRPAQSAKRLLNLIERAVDYGRLRPLNWCLRPLFRAKDAVWSRLKPSAAGSPAPTAAERKGVAFDAAAADVRMSWPSRALLARASVARLVDRRRRHYAKLLESLSGLPGCRPLFPALSGAVVPYAFALLIDDPSRVFPALKRAGVPIFRWEDLATDACPVSAEYSRSLLQFPCHQELRDAEVAWIAATVRRALGAV